MTRIRFNVKARKSWPITHRDLIKKATYWGAEALKIDKQPMLMLVRLMGRSEDHGDCLKLTNNKYIIHIHARKSAYRQVSTIFHELTHVKQCIYDNFDLEEHGARWKHGYVSTKDKKYWDLPWEIEARQTEKELRKMFFNLYKNNS